MTSHYTLSKAHRPDTLPRKRATWNLTTSPPLLLLTPFRRPPPVRSSVAASGEPGPMATESAGFVSVPSTHSPEGKPSSGGGPGTPGPVGSLQVGVSLGHPSGLAGPTDTQDREHMPSLSLDYYHRHRIDKYLDTLLANQPISDGEPTDHY